MNISLLWRVCRNITLGGILFLSFGHVSLLADVLPNALPQCKMRITTSASITLGEPVTIHAEIVNPSNDQRLWIRTGLYQTDWYTLSLVDQSGHTAAPIPDTRTREPKGSHGGNITIVQPSSSVPIDIVATRFLPILKPGKYILTIHVRAPYTQTETVSEDLTQATNQIKSGGNVLTDEFAFSLTVTPTNLLVLQSRADALKQNILKEPGSKSYYADLDMLFSMPEASAWTTWQSLANEGNTHTQEIVAARLEELHSFKASDLLMQMLDNSAQALPGLPAVSSRLPDDCLNRMYNDGSTELRAHIKSLYAQRGIQLPDKISLPTVID